MKIWHGEVVSSENSQHLTDWYTPSHIIHGFVFYWLLLMVTRRWSLGFSLFIATLIEAGWEIVENTPWIINHYREATISLDYFGDSVINSVFDIFAMFLGFYLARKLPVWMIIVLAIGLELFTGYMIRDGLILNILMFIHPFEGIVEWQMGR